jgi:hypothetical protein
VVLKIFFKWYACPHGRKREKGTLIKYYERKPACPEERLNH